MFSLIKKGIHALKPESCSLCPYGDGTHPPAKIRWDILDKEAKPLLSKKRLASGSLLMLPDQVEADRIGGPREAVWPDMFCEIRPYTELPRVALEAPDAVPPELSSPVAEPIRMERGTFEVSNRFAWAATDDGRSPRNLEGWLRTESDPAMPGSFQAARPKEWRPPVAGLRPGPLHPIDQEIEVQLRAQPSAFPLQAALPMSVPERLAWEKSGSLAIDWTPLGNFTAAPEIRKHRPLYAAPPTPLPVPALPRAVFGDLNPVAASRTLAGFQILEDRHLRNWAAASKNPNPLAQPPMAMPHAPLMRQRFRGWQGTPKSYEWRVRDETMTAGLEVSSCRPRDDSPVMIPGPIPVRTQRLDLAQGPLPRWARPTEMPLTVLSRHAPRFAPHSVSVPEIPD